MENNLRSRRIGFSASKQITLFRNKSNQQIRKRLFTKIQGSANNKNKKNLRSLKQIFTNTILSE